METKNTPLAAAFAWPSAILGILGIDSALILGLGMNIDGWIALFLISVAVLLPGAWWLVHNSRDQKEMDEYRQTIARRDAMLPEVPMEERQEFLCFFPFEPPAPSQKHMGIISVLAALIGASSIFFFP